MGYVGRQLSVVSNIYGRVLSVNDLLHGEQIFCGQAHLLGLALLWHGGQNLCGIK